MPKSRQAKRPKCPGCKKTSFTGIKRLIRHYYNQCKGVSGGTAVVR